jgi:hypothetical protein
MARRQHDLPQPSRRHAGTPATPRREAASGNRPAVTCLSVSPARSEGDRAWAASARAAGHSDRSSKPGGLAPVAACHAAAAPRWATTRDTAAPTANETDHTSASRHRTLCDAGFAGGSSCRLARQTAVIPQRKAAAAAAPDANATTSHIRRRTPNSFPARTLHNRTLSADRSMRNYAPRLVVSGQGCSDRGYAVPPADMPRRLAMTSFRWSPYAPCEMTRFLRCQGHARSGSPPVFSPVSSSCITLGSNSGLAAGVCPCAIPRWPAPAGRAGARRGSRNPL